MYLKRQDRPFSAFHTIATLSVNQIRKSWWRMILTGLNAVYPFVYCKFERVLWQLVALGKGLVRRRNEGPRSTGSDAQRWIPTWGVPLCSPMVAFGRGAFPTCYAATSWWTFWYRQGRSTTGTIWNFGQGKSKNIRLFSKKCKCAFKISSISLSFES